jgi:hypothetical protein
MTSDENTFFSNASYPCSVPTWLVTSNITQTSATFSWDAVSGAQSYSVQTRIPNGTWYNVPGSPVSGTNITVTWFLPNTTYQWRVRANCSYGESSYWSSPVTFTTLGGSSCDAPSWLGTNNITSTSATLDWEAVSGAMEYMVQYRVSGGSWYDVPGSPTTQTWINLSGLQPGTEYHWRVKTKCTNWVWSSWSAIQYFTTLGNSCYAPSWLQTSYITQSSAKFSWDAVPGAYSYSIQMRQSNGYWYNLPGGPFYGTWIMVYDLYPGTCYEWRVRANCSYNDCSPYSYPKDFCTLGYNCSVPTWPMSSGITQTTVTLSWDIVYGAQSYTVQIKDQNGYWYDLPGCPTYNTWIYVTGLQPCTTYQWRVRANCGYNNYSYWTKPKSFTTLCSYECHAPYSLYASDITDHSAKLGWNAVSGAISYSVQYRIVGSYNWIYVPGGPFTNNWISLHGLQPGTKYEWRVKTNCQDWSSSNWSYPNWFTTLGGGNSCVWTSGLTAHDITASSARLTWYAVLGASSYTVEIRQPNGQWIAVPGSPFVNPYVTVDGLSAATTYEWRVRTNCYNGGYSLWANAVFTTLGTSACSAPATLTTTQVTESTAIFDWSDASGALSYDLQLRVLPNGAWEFVTGGPWTQSFHQMTGLLPGTAYEWRVRSKCNAGVFSDWSVTSTFTTLSTPCTMPTGTATTAITDTSATIQWTAASGANSYDVQLKLPNGTWIDVPGSPFTVTSITIYDLIPGTAYSWRVRSNCNSNEHSAWTTQLNFTTTGSASSGSNECSGATELTVNSSCSNTASSNVGATESVPAPMGWCPENNYKDVWFKFTMPDVPSPVVTVRTSAGTLTDGILEVYRGADCQNLVFISCEDDNNNGNGSTMPVISVTGTANETIWVRVWGYAGTTGSFNICVFNYQSNDFAAPVQDTNPIDGDPLIQKEFNDQSFEEKAVSLQVNPNPARDQIRISVMQTDITSVTGVVLMDMSGKVVYHTASPSTDIREYTEEIDVSHMPRGVYILRIGTTTGIMTEKVMLAD